MKHLKSPIATGFSSGHKEFSNKCTFCLDEMLPKGTVLVECGKLLQRGGYRIKVLNTINFKKSMRYNPFAYIRSEKDILKLVNTLIANTKGDGEKACLLYTSSGFRFPGWFGGERRRVLPALEQRDRVLIVFLLDS